MRISLLGAFILAAAALGQIAAFRAAIDWVYTLRIRQHTFVALAVALGSLLALPVVMFDELATDGPRLLYRGDLARVPAAWIAVLGVSVTVAVAWLGALVRGARGKETPLQLNRSDRVVDVAHRLGARPAGTGIKAAVARLSGKHLFEIDCVDRTLALPGLDPAWSGFSIAHLSDLHLNGTPDRAFFDAAVDLVNEQKPDLIAVTGDVIDNRRVIDWVAPTLGRLSAPLGCSFILGNHDPTREPCDTVAILRGIGWRYVGGGFETLGWRGRQLLVSGNELPWHGRPPEVPPPAGELRLLLSHSPHQLRFARRAAFHLMLAGHLHGGQIRLPILGPLAGGRYASGLFHAPPTVMHVSRGLGVMTPIRFRCRAEVTRIMLSVGG